MVTMEHDIECYYDNRDNDNWITANEIKECIKKWMNVELNFLNKISFKTKHEAIKAILRSSDFGRKEAR